MSARKMEYNDCPCCRKRGVQQNKAYAGAMLRCRYCKAVWHSWVDLEESWVMPWSEVIPRPINQHAELFAADVRALGLGFPEV